MKIAVLSLLIFIADRREETTHSFLHIISILQENTSDNIEYKNIVCCFIFGQRKEKKISLRR